MENLKQILYEKQLELEEIEKTNKKTLERLPEGYVNISKNKNSIQYYWRKDDGTETYINKKNRSIIKKLAQKEYEKKVQIVSSLKYFIFFKFAILTLLFLLLYFSHSSVLRQKVHVINCNS